MANLSYIKTRRFRWTCWLAVLWRDAATNTIRPLQTQEPASAGTHYSGPQSTSMVGKFDNRSGICASILRRGGFDVSADKAKPFS